MIFPITKEANLPPFKTSIEEAGLDFKTTEDPKPTFEHAKDVAALASTVGGSIIIGATCAGNVVTDYPGVNVAVADLLPNAFEQSAAQRCRPALRVVSSVIRRTGKDPVVVVNVWPSPMAPVGVRTDAAAWVFPIRVGSQTRFLEPDQFATLENVSARRAAALLLSIPETERGHIVLRWLHMQGSMTVAQVPQENGAEFEGVVPADNVARFKITGDPSKPLQPLPIPLDWIETVWRDQENNRWVVTLLGQVELPGPMKNISAPRIVQRPMVGASRAF